MLNESLNQFKFDSTRFQHFLHSFNNESEYMKIHTFELGKKEWISEWSLQLYTQLLKLRI